MHAQLYISLGCVSFCDSQPKYEDRSRFVVEHRVGGAATSGPQSRHPHISSGWFCLGGRG